MSGAIGTAAVIVTFNRSAKLMKVLDALAVQTMPPEVILVVDNASTDDTAALLAARAESDPRLRHIRLPVNAGGAGGFHAGMRVACQMGAAHLWLSDDDAYPRPDALERLHDALARFEQDTGRRPSFACSRVEWIDGSLCEMNCPRPVWDWARFVQPGAGWALVDSCSFVSALVPAWAVRKHGLPIAEYFIWFDDAEFTRRISRSHPGIFVPESVVVHDTPENRGVNYGLVDEASLWKFVYGARNEASFRRREVGLISVLAFAYGARGQMRRHRVPARLRRKIYGAILRGLSFRPKIVRL